jgi:hypothetical protein
MAGTEHEIHVLVLPYPSQGHINPILQFGKRLAAHRGVRCTLAATRFLLSESKPTPGDAVRVTTISDGCDRGGFAEAGGLPPTWSGSSRPGRRPWTSSSGQNRRREGPCTCWCTTRSCRGRSDAPGGTAQRAPRSSRSRARWTWRTRTPGRDV